MKENDFKEKIEKLRGIPSDVYIIKELLIELFKMIQNKETKE